MTIRRNPNPRLTRKRTTTRQVTRRSEPDDTLAATFDRLRAREMQEGGTIAPGRTSPLVRGLRAMIRDREIRSIVDVSCGDMGWWPHILGDTPEGAITFHGFDISPVAIQRNRDRFMERTDWHFQMADARFHEYPEADLLICRRTLNHLWSVDAQAVRANVARAARLVGFTHDPSLRSNPPDGMRHAVASDCPRATPFTPMNVRRPPFMPMPMVHTVEDEDAQILAFFPGRSFA